MISTNHTSLSRWDWFFAGSKTVLSSRKGIRASGVSDLRIQIYTAYPSIIDHRLISSDMGKSKWNWLHHMRSSLLRLFLTYVKWIFPCLMPNIIAVSLNMSASELNESYINRSCSDTPKFKFFQVITFRVSGDMWKNCTARLEIQHTLASMPTPCDSHKRLVVIWTPVFGSSRSRKHISSSFSPHEEFHDPRRERRRCQLTRNFAWETPNTDLTHSTPTQIVVKLGQGWRFETQWLSFRNLLVTQPTRIILAIFGRHIHRNWHKSCHRLRGRGYSPSLRRP